MNIFGRNSNVIINNCGGKSTVIINGKVVKGDGVNLNYNPFNKEKLISENITDVFVNTSSADILFKTADTSMVKYSGKFAEKEPNMTTTVVNGCLIIELEETEFLQDTLLEITVPDKLDSIKVSTMSGDVNVNNFNINNVDISTMSGDIDFDCKTNVLYLNTISGDIESIVNTDSVNISSTSGDVDAKIVDIKNSAFNTTSGDINIEVENIEPYINAISVSGRVKNKVKTITSSSSKIINVSSVSGDIYLF